MSVKELGRDAQSAVAGSIFPRLSKYFGITSTEMAGAFPSASKGLKSNSKSQVADAGQTASPMRQREQSVTPLETQGPSQSIQVTIAGVPLRLRSSHDAATVYELVELVDQKVREALPLTKTGSIQNASILAALNMAEELLLLKRRAKEMIGSIEARAQRVIEDLENPSPANDA